MGTSEELSGPVKAFIVQRLARFEAPSQVVKAVKEEFGFDLSRQRVHFYDPTTKAGRALQPELKELFFEAREQAKKDLDSIPSYHKAVRLRRLDAMINIAIERGNLVLAAQLLEHGISRREHLDSADVGDEAAAGRRLAEPWGVLNNVALAGRPCILLPGPYAERESVEEGINFLHNVLSALPKDR